MHDSKKSFILHIDSLAILDEMTFEQKGILFDAIYKYQIGVEVELDFGMKMAFATFKNQFNRDNQKYNEFINKQKDNGKKGGRPKNPTHPNQTQKTQALFQGPKKAYNDNKNESANTNVKVNNIEERKLKFASTLEPYLNTYGRNLLIDFYRYWTEPNKSNTKFKMELEKTWDLGRRLETWAKNDKSFSKQPTNKSNQSFVNAVHGAANKLGL